LDNTDGAPSGPPVGGLIAVSGQKREHDKLGRYPLAYVKALQLAGGKAMVLAPFALADDPGAPPEVPVRASVDPDDPTLLEGATGLVLTGGGDFDPALFGQSPHPRTYNINPDRDRLELNLLDSALARDLPVLAICRGMQGLNIFLGGSLDQHLADTPGRLHHDRDRPRGDAAHGLRVEAGSVLEEIVGARELGVNSHHHQGLDGAAAPLVEIGWAEDGVLEAVVSTAHTFVLGIQWHPEVMAPINRQQAAIFERFVHATTDYAARDQAALRG
jgi:putative glutamine amidotransferase